MHIFVFEGSKAGGFGQQLLALKTDMLEQDHKQWNEWY